MSKHRVSISNLTKKAKVRRARIAARTARSTAQAARALVDTPRTPRGGNRA